MKNTNERTQTPEEAINEGSLLHVIGRKFGEAYNAGREKRDKNGRYLSLESQEGSRILISQIVIDKMTAYVTPDEDYKVTKIQIIGDKAMEDEFGKDNFQFDRVVYKISEHLDSGAPAGNIVTSGAITKEVLGWVESEQDGRKVTTCIAEPHELRPDEINVVMSEISSAREVEAPGIPLGISGVTIS